MCKENQSDPKFFKNKKWCVQKVAYTMMKK